MLPAVETLASRNGCTGAHFSLSDVRTIQNAHFAFCIVALTSARHKYLFFRHLNFNKVVFGTLEDNLVKKETGASIYELALI